jgi:hypothetical protein
MRPAYPSDAGADGPCVETLAWQRDAVGPAVVGRCAVRGGVATLVVSVRTALADGGFASDRFGRGAGKRHLAAAAGFESS